MGTHPGWAAHAELGPLGVLQLADGAFDLAEHLDATCLMRGHGDFLPLPQVPVKQPGMLTRYQDAILTRRCTLFETSGAVDVLPREQWTQYYI